MKRRHNDPRRQVALDGERSQIGWLFRRKPSRMTERKGNRRARAIAADNRRAYLGLILGAVIGVTLLLMVILVPPTVSTEELVAAVKAQKAHAARGNFSNLPSGGAPRTRGENVSAATPETKNRSDILHEDRNHLAIGFDKLSGFPFVVTEQMVDTRKESSAAFYQTMGQVPDEIKALNEKTVALKGFILPMKFDHGLTTEFLLLKNQGLCCYGLAPKITEWVNVRMTGKGVKPIMDEPVTVRGTFHVGDVRENGQLLGIYRMDADQVKLPGR